MYDPARDIFTENKPVVSPPAQRYQLSALDTLAGLAAEAEIASVPVKQEPSNAPVKEPEPVKQEAPAKVNGAGATIKTEHAVGGAERRDRAPDGGGVEEVARTKQPERSLKVTLYLKRNPNAIKKQDMPDANGIQDQSTTNDTKSDKEKAFHGNKHDDVSPISPMKKSSPPESAKAASPPSEPPKSVSPKKDDATTKEAPRAELNRDGPAYPIPLSLSKLGKIPKRKVEDRERRVDRDQSRSRNADKERTTGRSNRSPPRSRSPARRLSDDRYRPSSHIDSYRPSRDRDEHYPPRDREDHYPPRDRDDHYPPRDRDDHYVPSKRARSPSPPRQFKRPVRREITAVDRERERRERQLREAERQRADLEAARSRPVYEAVRQHYNEREDRGREARQESRIFRLRKFNNWIKSVLIGKFIPDRTEEQVDEDRGLFVLDIGCGKGGDLGKWQKQNQVQMYVGVDAAEVSIVHARQRAAEMRGRRFDTEFFALDCFVVCSCFLLSALTFRIQYDHNFPVTSPFSILCRFSLPCTMPLNRKRRHASC